MKTSRILNEKSGFMGLGALDLAGVGYFLILTHTLFEKINLEIFSFIITGILTVILIQIRLAQRPKFIRDLLKYYFLPKSLTSKNGIFYVTKA